MKTTFAFKLILKVFLVVFVVVVFDSCSVLKDIRYYTLIAQGNVVQKNYSHTFPFEYKMGGIIVVKAYINGEEEPMEFIFDTGASITMISVEASEKLGLQKIGESTAFDANNTEQDHDLVTVSSIKFGDIEFRNIVAGTVEYDENSIIRCIAKDGIIGANLISKSNWNIDFENQLITLTDKPEKFYDKTANRIPFRKSHAGRPSISAMVNGTLMRDILIDMGSNGSIDIPLHMKDSLQVPAGEIRSFIDGTTQGIFSRANDTVYTGFLHEVHLGDVMASNIPVKFSNSRSLKMGNEVLSNYNITLNYKKREIVMQPATAVKVKNLVVNGYGIILDRNAKGEIVVRNVFENSPAHRAGVKEGDVIRKINNEALINRFSDFCSFQSYRDYIMMQDEMQLHIRHRHQPVTMKRVVRPSSTASLLFPFYAAS